jgi:hypothetical protein
LQKHDTILFLSNYYKAGYWCYISKITLEEVYSNYRKQLKQKVESFNSSVNSLKRQIKLNHDVLPDEFIQKECDKYRDFLIGRLREYNIKIAPIPSESHETILNHLFEGKHPFDNKDNGYKDYLIFRTILNSIETKKMDAILVSADNDFGIKTLHPDLEHLNSTSKKVILRKNINELNSNELREQINITNAENAFVLDLFKDEKHENLYVESVLENIKNEELEFPTSKIFKAIDTLEPPKLVYVHFDSETGSIKSVNPLNEKTTLVVLSVSAYLYYEIDIKHSNSYQLDTLPNDCEITKIGQDDDYKLLEVGCWNNLNLKVQADRDGNNIEFFEIEIEE